jgi:crotonobetaine/carnitine-CoA ligase
MCAKRSTDQIVLSRLLKQHATNQPEKVFIHFPEGGSWTYQNAFLNSRRAASGFSRLGVQRGDKVLCLLPNGEAFMRSWFGSNFLGAVHSPCNTAWRGQMLENALAISGGKVAVVAAELLSRFAEIDTQTLEKIIVIGESEQKLSNIELVSENQLSQHDDLLEPAEMTPDDDMQIIFTSGTTGPSKGALCSYRHLSEFLLECLPECFGPDQNYLVVAPLFHGGGLSGVYSQLMVGGSVVVPNRFKSDTFWPMVRNYQVTSTTLLGVMTSFLLSAPVADDDKSHPMKVVSIAPLNDDAFTFAARFGVTLWTSYGATEMGAIISCAGDEQCRGALGYLNKGVESRIVDKDFNNVAIGEIGELLVRSTNPKNLFSEYFRNSEASAKAYHEDWYCTGDMIRKSESGLFYFADRRKDCIRRRGENISSLEVEKEVMAFPGINEVAAYAVPSEFSEDEIMVAISSSDLNDAPNWRELVSFLTTRMPHYMVPRYYRLMTELPKTETGKVKKELLRQDLITSDSWDREAAGIKLRGERLG